MTGLTLIRNYHTDACCENVAGYARSEAIIVNGQTATVNPSKSGSRIIRPIPNSLVQDWLTGKILYVDFNVQNLEKTEFLQEIWSNGSQHAYLAQGKYVAFWLDENGSITFNEIGIYEQQGWNTLLEAFHDHPNITYKTAPLPM